MPQTDIRDPALRRIASRTSLIVALILVGVKFVAWLATGSVALLTSAVDALVDTGASLATFFGVRYAERPPTASTASATAKARPSQVSRRLRSWRAPLWCWRSNPSSA